MKLYFFLLLPFLPVSAMSQTGVQDVHEVAQSSGTISTISISSQTAIDVASTTANGILYGSFAVEVYNLSVNTNTINCGFDVNVSTISTNNLYGREILPGTGMTFAIRQSKIPLFCKTQNTTSSTRATITQLR